MSFPSLKLSSRQFQWIRTFIISKITSFPHTCINIKKFEQTFPVEIQFTTCYFFKQIAKRKEDVGSSEDLPKTVTDNLSKLDGETLQVNPLVL